MSEDVLSSSSSPMPTTAGAVAADGTHTVDWRSSLPDDLKPLAQAKGWKSPAEALKSYAHLERLIGAERVALPAKDANGQRDWSQWEGWAALGRPEAPERYVFKGAKDGNAAPTAIDREFQSHMAPLLHRAGLAQWQVDLLAEGFDGFNREFRGRSETRAQAEMAAAETELRRDWDRSFDRHMDLANRAVRQFGGAELARALGQSGLGRNPAVVRAFARIGAALAEDGGMPHDRPGPMQGGASAGTGSARAEIQRLKGDGEFQQAFLNRLHPGHDAAMARMLRLQAQVSLIDGGAR